MDDHVPSFGRQDANDISMNLQNRKKQRSSLTVGDSFIRKKKRDHSSNRGGDNLHESGNMLNTSVFNDNDDQYKIEPGT